MLRVIKKFVCYREPLPNNSFKPTLPRSCALAQAIYSRKSLISSKTQTPQAARERFRRARFRGVNGPLRLTYRLIRQLIDTDTSL